MQSLSFRICTEQTGISPRALNASTALDWLSGLSPSIPELDEKALKEIRSAANGGFALGNQRFKDEISAMLGRRVERLRQRLRQRASQSG
jgi:hypothetical protein